MSDPCGIVDTIQSNLPVMESVATSACLGAVDTTNNAALTQGEEDDREIHEAPTDEKDLVDEEKKDDSSSKSGETTASKPKKTGGLLRRWTSKIMDEEPSTAEEKEEEPPKIDPISDLSDPNRKICVVTTAALPWRTGTAVNPLARALYLTRGRPKYSVTLMIPWLTEKEDQAKVYGKNIFETPEEQEEWIRTYCRERIFNSTEDSETNTDSNDEVDNLQIRFYPSNYHDLFRSIFASVDICALIPQEEADIAILEEPEHLTWFRALPPSNSPSTSPSSASTSIMQSMMDTDSVCGANLTTGVEEDSSNEDGTDAKENDNATEDLKKLEEQAIIGWTSKFNYVVGILHTNYSAYMRQYGLFSSFLTSNALQALSSLVVKAYTHKLIRLSGTLPELDKSKEMTCNVHGVRPEFFVVEQEENPPAPSAPEVVATEEDVLKPEADDEATEQMTVSDATTDTIEAEEVFQPEPVYFIGKVIWAKGFDKLLKVQDLYREETGEYFPIDIYGSGGDFDAISRAFLGRSGLAKRITSSGSVKSLAEGSQCSDPGSPVQSPKDQTAALLFGKEGNLRGQIDDLQTTGSSDLMVDAQAADSPTNSTEATPSNVTNYPKQIIDQLGEKTKETGTGVTKAITRLSEKISNIGFRSLYTEEGEESEGSNDGNATADIGSTLASKFRFDPPKSRYELRRQSIPARFLGVKDHAMLRDVPGHKIFVNLSITEVLCTTTAEALAMGKFVVIPEHPSNTFFLQFPNCLAYKSKKECVEKIKFALKNDPTPLTPEVRHKLTWEGANKRLYESALMTEAEAKERNKKTGDFARLHMGTIKTGALFQSGGFGLGLQTDKKKTLIEKEEPIEKEAEEETAETPEKPLLGICSPKKPLP